MWFPELEVMSPPGMTTEWQLVGVELVQNSRINLRAEPGGLRARGRGEPGLFPGNAIAPEAVLIQRIPVKKEKGVVAKNIRLEVVLASSHKAGGSLLFGQLFVKRARVFHIPEFEQRANAMPYVSE